MDSLLDGRSDSPPPDLIDVRGPSSVSGFDGSPADATSCEPVAFDGAAEALAAAARARRLVKAERRRDAVPSSQPRAPSAPRRWGYTSLLLVALLAGSILMFASATVADIAGVWNVPTGE